ncbi:hypothetical protein ABFY27_10500 [Akkermansia massiliensis]
MDLIEAVDVKANLLAMHALANAYYARSRSLNRENGSPLRTKNCARPPWNRSACHWNSAPSP